MDLEWNWKSLLLLAALIILLILAAIFYRLSITPGSFFHCDLTGLANMSKFKNFFMNKNQTKNAMDKYINNRNFTDSEYKYYKDNGSKVAVISISITPTLEDGSLGAERKFAKISRKRLEKYCDIHGYDLHYYTENINNDYKPFWQKVVAMKVILDKKDKHGNRKYDSAFWIDDDIFITNMGYKLDDFYHVSSGNGKDIIMSRDILDNNVNIHINTGTYLVKNTEIGRKFIDETLDGYYWYKGWYQNNRYHEQTIMTYLYFRDYHDYIEVLPHGVMQSFYREDHWKYGDFCMHLAGDNSETREKVMKALMKCDRKIMTENTSYIVTTTDWKKMIYEIKFKSS